MKEAAEQLRNLTEVEVELRRSIAEEHNAAQLNRLYQLLHEVRKSISEITDR